MIQRLYITPPSFDFLKLAFFILASLLLTHRATSQALTFNHLTPTEISVCQPGKTFTISFTNNSGSTLTNLVANVQFPTGIHYVAGSLTNVIGGTVTEANISNTNQVQFSAGSLAANATRSFDVIAEARFAAYNHVLGGNIFRNTVNLTFSGGSVSSQTNSYNVLYPALTITSLSPLTGSVNAGQTFTRTVTIVNGGFGAASQVKLKDTHGNSLTLTASSKGVLNTAGSEILLSASDFASIGDGDGLFEKNEAITLTETLLASGCSGTNSTLQAFWGCGGSETGSNIPSASTTITLANPSLGAVPTPSFNTCVGSSAMPQRLKLTNSGTGIAQTVALVISPTSTDIYTGIDPASIQYKVNGGNLTPIPASSTTATANYTCLAGRVGGFTVALPNIPPGSNIEVFWNSYTCAVSACGQVKLVGWKYSATCKDACNSQTFTKSGTGQEEKTKNVTVFFESPSDLANGQTGNYLFILSSATVNLPSSGSNTSLKAVFDLPDGLVWSGSPADLQFVNGTDAWQPSSTVFDPVTKKLTAAYPYPAPFALLRSELRLNLTMNCGSLTTSANATVGMQLFYAIDNTCPTPYELPLSCKSAPITKLHCLGSCLQGMLFQAFKIERTSFGKPDNNLDGLPDATGSLDESKIKKNRVMASDTFRTVFTGKIMTSATYPSWAFGKAKSVIPNGDKITVLGATLRVTDASTGQVLTCNNVPYTQQLSGTNRTVTFNFSPATLASGGCSSFSGFVLQQDDVVELTANYRVSGNLGGSIKQLTVDNDFYVTQTATSAAFQCDDWNGNFTLIGYAFSNSKSETVSVNTCTKVIEQSFYLGVGDCCTNYAGGDYFPSEYRHWAKVNEMTLSLPAGYTLVSANLKYYRTLSTNKTALETIATLTPASVNGQQYVYNLGALFTDQGGTLNPGDDGFNGTVYVEVKPNCTVEENTNQLASWQFRFKEGAALGGNVTVPYTSSADILKYKKGRVEALAATQSIESTGTTVSWDVTIKNNGEAVAPNSWFYLLSPNGLLTVTEVKRISNGAVLSPVSGFYKLGSMNAAQSLTYRISATFYACTSTQLILYSGSDCNGYPVSLADFPCNAAQYPLIVTPEESELQARLLNPAASPTIACNAPLLVELELLSAKLASIKDIVIQIQMPSGQSLSIVPGSVKKLYPASGSFQTIATPVISGNTYTITGADIDPVIGSTGLTGITDVTANTVKIRFELALGAQFKPGNFAIFTIASKRPCGSALPTLAFAFDPNAFFRKMDGTGLQSAGDNWASSWGDYNNDGYVDIFVTTYGEDDPNDLFKNNGDGTFTKITTGSIVTDKASSLASTWGDYDNDGDLDIFVANNVGDPKFLYRNDGNDIFTRIVDDPVVNDLGYGHGTSWVDYDNDGWLDLFVASFFSTHFNLLYHNNRDGSFTRTDNNAIAVEASSSVAGVWGDYDNDGLPDLFVANTNDENNSLYRNTGNGTFTKITSGSIVNDGGTSVGASWGDYDNDGWLDLFVANAGNENDFLYRNNRDGTFTKITSGAIVSSGGHSHGSAWADYDNDGWLDLVVANDQGQNEFLYHNNGDGTFTPVSNAITQNSGNSFGVAWADYDNDGDPDLWVNNRGSEDNALFNNTRGQCQSHLTIKLTGTRSNKSAIGAKVFVKANIYGQEVSQMREVTAQSGGGIGGQSDMKLIFGLGDALAADSIIIKWPSGLVQVLTDQPAGVPQNITEPFSSEVCGTVYQDANANCQQDAGEMGIPNAKIVLQPGNISAYTNASGRYSVFVKTGLYGIQEFAPANWSPTCPNAQGTRAANVTVLGASYCGNDFGNTPLCDLPDLRSEIASTAHRIGEQNLMVVNFENMGADTASDASLTVAFPQEIRLLESTLTPKDYAANLATWQLQELLPGEKGAIYLTYEVLTEATLGKDLRVTSTLNSSEADCNSANNSFVETSRAVASFDPNDISVSPERIVHRGEWLHYKIRFQNMGNLPASRVRVEDVLPDGLDLFTLEMGAASHTYLFKSEGTKLTWTFPNINLPDSLSNESGSHGFLTFRIKARAELAIGDKILNSAHIIFDNLQPVATNVVENLLSADVLEESFAHARPLLVYPNPTPDRFTVQALDTDLQGGAFFVHIQVTDYFGKPVLTAEGLEIQRATLSMDMVPTGAYIVKAVDNTGQVYFGKIVVGRG